MLFTAWSTTLYDARVEWLSLRTGERRTLVAGGASGRYADGRLLWARPDGTVVAAPFDPRSARLLGEPAPLLADVVPHPFYAFAQLAVGGDTLVYLPGTATPLGQRRLARLDGDVERPLPTPSRFFRNLETEPAAGGSRQPCSPATAPTSGWSTPTSGALNRLTFDGFNIEPVWSPDGEWVAYSSNRLGPFNVFRSRADGSRPAERMLAGSHHQHPTSFSPDGRELMVGDVGNDTGFDLWVLDLRTKRLRPLLRTPANEIYAVWSPDARWFAYCSDESGEWEVFVAQLPRPGRPLAAVDRRRLRPVLVARRQDGVLPPGRQRLGGAGGAVGARAPPRRGEAGDAPRRPRVGLGGARRRPLRDPRAAPAQPRRHAGGGAGRDGLAGDAAGLALSARG